jgi:hypothetical protein
MIKEMVSRSRKYGGCLAALQRLLNQVQRGKGKEAVIKLRHELFSSSQKLDLQPPMYNAIKLYSAHRASDKLKIVCAGVKLHSVLTQNGFFFLSDSSRLKLSGLKWKFANGNGKPFLLRAD